MTAPPTAAPPPPRLPLMTRAGAVSTREVEALDQHGERRRVHLPDERPLTLYVDRQELVTLMTLGAEPELLALGYLRNQRLVERVDEVLSITADWDVNAVAVRTRAGVADFARRTARRIVTTGCGQGAVFGGALDVLGTAPLPDAASARISQRTLRELLEVMRNQPDSVHRMAGSVHGCALFRGAEVLSFVEDVGRHNAIDTIAGWMWMHGVAGADKIFYTTGRLTSEMVMKSAQLGVPIVVSRNGVTALGHELAAQLGMTLFGRAANRHFIAYCGFERFDAEPEAQRAAVRVVAG